MGKETYRKQIIDLRARIARERQQKKRDNEHYARLVKGASSLSSKTLYRKNKIDRAAYHDRNIASLKRSIENAKTALKRCK